MGALRAWGAVHSLGLCHPEGTLRLRAGWSATGGLRPPEGTFTLWRAVLLVLCGGVHCVGCSCTWGPLPGSLLLLLLLL